PPSHTPVPYTTLFRSDLIPCTGTGEQIALRSVATAAAKEVRLLLGLHAFRGDCQLQMVSHGDDRLYDGGVVRIEHDVAHEAFIEDRKSTRLNSSHDQI